MPWFCNFVCGVDVWPVGARVQYTTCPEYISRSDLRSRDPDNILGLYLCIVPTLLYVASLRIGCPDPNLRNRCPDRVQNSRRTIILDDDKLWA